MNSNVQGNVGLGQAIAYFTGIGYSVSIPLTESQRYDIITDDGERLYRVEVKTTTLVRLSGNYEVCTVTKGRSGGKKSLSETDADVLFVYVIPTGDRYLFPIGLFEGKSSITLSPDKDMYKV